MKTNKYSTDCGLSRQEWELDKLADNILECKTSLGRIGILRKYMESFAKERAVEFAAQIPIIKCGPNPKENMEFIYDDFTKSETK